MRSVLAMCLLALCAQVAVADEVHVPDAQANVGSKNLIPFNPSIVQRNCRYQALYFASKLGNAGFSVKDIAFAPAWTGDFKATQMQIRMSHFTGSSLVATLANNIPNPVTVYNGPITWNTTTDTWSPMGLTGNFVWNGTDNIVVDIRYQAGTVSGSGSQGACRVVSGAIPRNWTYGNYNATTRGGTDATGGLKTRFTVDLASITVFGKASPGATVPLLLTTYGDAGLPYQLGTSLGTGPIPIDTRQLNLTLDGLLLASVGGSLPSVFVNYSGIIDQAGLGQAFLGIPAIPALVGVTLHNAFVTIKSGAPSGIRSISKTASFMITT